MRAVKNVVWSTLHLSFTIIPVIMFLLVFSALSLWVTMFIVIGDGIHILFREVPLVDEDVAVFMQIYAFKCILFIFCVGTVAVLIFF